MISLLISFYQKIISPPLHFLNNLLFGNRNHCRFSPTCSEYSKIAFQKHGFVFGSYLSIIRVVRCNPIFPGGFDPVPDKI